MIYNFTLGAALNTPSTSPAKQTLHLTHGIIHKLDILFPPGCLGLVGISIHTALHQVWPSNPDEYFTSDAETISYRENYQLLYEPFELESWVYNIDDTYNHNVILRIGILPVSVVSPWLQSYDERLLAALGVG